VVTRVVAIGDLNGADQALEQMLLGLGLVDSRGRWRGGATQLVQLGDVFNRGPGARRALLRRAGVDQEVDLDDVKSGRAPDVALQPGDEVIVKARRP